MRSGRIISLVIVLVWFYFFLAAIVNPISTPPNVPNNPLIPFLPADAVALLWPPILISTPIVLVAGKRLIKPSGGPQREISPEEFIRIQTRAIRMSEADRQGARRSAPPATASAPRAQHPSTAVEPVEMPAKKGVVQEAAKPTATVSKESEFTPPPTASRETTAKEPLTPEKGTAEQPKKELEIAAHLGPVDKFKDIEELEAEKGAVLSLTERLEEMKNTETIERKLYEKLKRKYDEQIEKIDKRIRELSESKTA